MSTTDMTSTATPSTSTAPADLTALKAKHRAMWASGDYPKLASDLIWSLGPVLVKACAVGAGQRVLDVAAGSGNVALAAARAGATVTASDLTPELLDAGRRTAAAEGLELTWQQADAEALPFADDSFDTVLSCVGVMFAPHHQASADELVRVCRPGGTVGLISWTPAGFIGQLFATMRPFVPPAPAGAQPPPLWGDEQHLRQLFGDRVSDLTARRQSVAIGAFSSPEAFRDYFKTWYGPTISAYRGLAEDTRRTAELDDAIASLARQYRTPGTTGGLSWEYLLATARVR